MKNENYLKLFFFIAKVDFKFFSVICITCVREKRTGDRNETRNYFR